MWRVPWLWFVVLSGLLSGCPATDPASQPESIPAEDVGEQDPGGTPGATGAAIAPVICPPGVNQTVCASPKSVTQCSADGTAWRETSCVSGTCLNGLCLDLACPPGEVLCTDQHTLSACVDSGQGHDWLTIETCDGLCQAGACLADCGFDVKRNLGKACVHYVVGLSGAGQGDCVSFGRLVVPSSAEDELVIFDTDADPPTPLPGSPFATCDDPSRIALDPDDSSVVATCRGDGHVRRHASNGFGLWDTPLPACGSSRGVARQGGRLFVGCTDTGNVHELDLLSGVVLASSPSEVAVYGLTADADGVYASDATGLTALSTDPLEVQWHVDGAPYGLVADGQGSLWTAEAPGLWARSTEDGSVTATVEIPEVVNAPPDLDTGGCNGVAVGLDGRIYAGCADVADVVVIWDPQTEQLEHLWLPEADHHPRGVAVNAVGEVFSINLATDTVTRFSEGEATSFGAPHLTAPYAYGGDLAGLSACVGVSAPVQWKSPVLDFGEPETHWLAVEWTSEEPPGTSITVQYRIGSGPWQTTTNGAPIDKEGQTFQTRALLQSDSPPAVPTLTAVAVFHE
ncbi:MAG: hypothetical protein ACI9WU_001268 [Myxococcota bacterium]|jgi:hypothetical protein